MPWNVPKAARYKAPVPTNESYTEEHGTCLVAKVYRCIGLKRICLKHIQPETTCCSSRCFRWMKVKKCSFFKEAAGGREQESHRQWCFLTNGWEQIVSLSSASFSIKWENGRWFPFQSTLSCCWIYMWILWNTTSKWKENTHSVVPLSIPGELQWKEPSAYNLWLSVAELSIKH